MAENNDQDARTEPATHRRREEAREHGQVAFSADLITGVLLLAGVAAILMSTDYLGSNLLTAVRLDLLGAGLKELNPQLTQSIFVSLAQRGITSIGAILGVLFVIILSSALIQVGFVPNLELLGIKWDRVNPFLGGKFFSLDKLIRSLISVLKVVVVGLIAWWMFRGQLPVLGRLNELQLAAGISQGWGSVIRLAFGIAGGLLLIGLIDYFLHRWRFEQSIMMTRQEIRDEQKRDEGDPQIKARIRKLQRELARKKMFQNVKTATVVITNPTHLAVALRYERGIMQAPKVVAKGAGHVAQRIRELAREAGIPVIERKSVAQALFRSVKLDQDIPAGLFHVVAEILAYVYRLRGQAASFEKARS